MSENCQKLAKGDKNDLSNSHGNENFELEKPDEIDNLTVGSENFTEEEKNRLLKDCFSIGLEHYKNKIYPKAFHYFVKAGENGYVKAQNTLGYCYFWGVGIAQDYEKSLKWYEKSAKQGDAEGQYMVGLFYYKGYEVTQDYTQALKWFKKSAEKGFPGAQYYMGQCYYYGNGVTQNCDEAKKWYLMATEKDHKYAREALDSLLG